MDADKVDNLQQALMLKRAATPQTSRPYVLWYNSAFVWMVSPALMVTIWRIKAGQVVSGAIFSLWG